MTERYRVQATAVVYKNGGRVTGQVPTFLLDARIQCIRNTQHAEEIARKVIDPLDLCEEVHVSVVPEEECVL